MRLFKVVIYGKNHVTMNDIARVQIIMLDTDAISVAENARRQMGYPPESRVKVEEMVGPFDSGYLISYRMLTNEPLPESALDVINPSQEVLNEYDALFDGEAIADWIDDD